MTDQQVTEAQIEALLDRGEENGCVELSEVDQLIQSLELDDDAVEQLYERLDERSIDLRDVVDPPGRPARRCQQGTDDPHPRAHRRARAEDRPRRAGARDQAQPTADRRRGRADGKAAAEAGAGGT